jgi:hypothetical protein
MERGENLHARTQLAVVSNRDLANVEDDAIEVEEYPLA